MKTKLLNSLWHPVASCHTLKKHCQSQETPCCTLLTQCVWHRPFKLNHVVADKGCADICWHHRISRLSRHDVRSSSELLSPWKGALGRAAFGHGTNGCCILRTREIQEVQRSRMWCRWCVGYPASSKFTGKDPNCLVNFQIWSKTFSTPFWTTWPSDLVLQNDYLYGWGNKPELANSRKDFKKEAIKGKSAEAETGIG